MMREADRIRGQAVHGRQGGWSMMTTTPVDWRDHDPQHGPDREHRRL